MLDLARGCTGVVRVYGVTAAGVEWTRSPEHEQ